MIIREQSPKDESPKTKADLRWTLVFDHLREPPRFLCVLCVQSLLKYPRFPGIQNLIETDNPAPLLPSGTSGVTVVRAASCAFFASAAMCRWRRKPRVASSALTPPAAIDS